MKKILNIMILFLVITACVESGSQNSNTVSSAGKNATENNSTGVTISSVAVSSSSIKADYDQSTFSQYIYIHKTENKMLIDYNFFPDGSDLCQQATYNEITNPNGCRVDKTIVIPCEYTSITGSDLLAINVSAPSADTDCENNLVIDLNDAEFNVDGLIFSVTAAIDIFAADFEFNITREGFVDTKDGTLLSFGSTEVDLEAVYDKIIGLRTN